jgi:hypothetical protein
MKLVSLKNEGDSDCCCSMPMSNYGYSLRLYLNSEQCEALGITKAPAGSKVTISAMAIVVSATESVENDGDGGGNDLSMDLQITDMGVSVGAVMKDAASVLYGSSD